MIGLGSDKNEYFFWMNIRDFKKMNNFFEWIFWFLKKMNICFEWIFWIFKKNEYLFWMNILDFYKMNNFLNKHFGFTLPASIMVVAKCLKLIWNQSGIIRRTYFSPFQGVYYLYRGLRRAPKPYFGLILEFWIIFLIFCEWIIYWIFWTLLNEYFFEWIFWIWFWMNIFLSEYFGFCFELNHF